VRTIALLVALLVARAAYADPDPHADPDPTTAQAESHFAAGTQHYNLGEWDAAIASFKQAYALMPDPLFLFDIAQAYRLSGNCREAQSFYRTYLRNDPTGAQRAKAEKLLVDLDPCPAAPERAEIAAAAPPPPRFTGTHVAAIATASAGVLLGIAGGAFSWRARDAAAKVEAQCANGCSATEIVALDERGRASDRDATICYALAGAAVVAGVSLYLYAESRPRESVAVAPTPGGAVVSASLEF